MVIITVLTVYALGMILAPVPTRAGLGVLRSVIGTLTVVLFILWRIFPSSTGATFRRL
jgi:hypothetical protein